MPVTVGLLPCRATLYRSRLSHTSNEGGRRWLTVFSTGDDEREREYISALEAQLAEVEAGVAALRQALHAISDQRESPSAHPTQQSKTIRFLLVEDNPGDVALFRHAAQEADCAIDIEVCEDGEQALKHLPQLQPEIIVLDLNIPRIDGREVLTRVKSDTTLRTTPVIVWSSTQNPAEIKEVYKMGANCFIPKCTGIEECVQTVADICQMWTRRASLPPKG